MTQQSAMDHSAIRNPHSAMDLRPGNHICCLFQTEEEHRAVLTPFLRHGLERGEKVLYIVDAHTAEVILGYLRDEGVDVEACLERGQFAILTRDDAYMQEGMFDPERMIALLRAETERALAEGYPALRVTGEMTWALRGLPGSERLIEYEARLNEFFPGSRCLALCQYDRRRFDAALLLDVLRTHPIAVIGTEVYDNFYYIPPAEFLSEYRPAVELQHWEQSLAQRRQREEQIRHLNAVLRAIRNVNQLITREKERDRLLQGACENLIRTRGYHTAWIALLDENGRLVTAAEASLGEEFLALVKRLEAGDIPYCAQAVLAQADPLLIADTVSTCAGCPLASTYGSKQALSMRLKHGEKLYGLLTVSVPGDVAVDEDERVLFREIAGDIAFALHSIELEEKRRQAEEELNRHAAALSGLNAIAFAVSQSLDLQTTLAAALDATLQAIGFEAGGIALWNEAEQRLERPTVQGVEPEALAAFLGSPRPGGHRERLLRLGQPVFHDDTTHDPTVNPEIARHGFTLSAMVPLAHAGKVLGIMAVATRAPRRWTDGEKRLLIAAGQQIAVALANARLYEQTRQSEEKYRDLVNTTTDLIFTVDVQGKILFANPAARAFTGYEPEEAIGHHFSEYVHPDDVPILLRGIQQVLSGEPLESIKGIGQPSEYRMRKRDGQIIWVQTRAWLVRDAEGKIVGFSGISRDITELKQAQEALRLSQERFALAVQGANDGIWDWDIKNNTLYWSPRMKELLGYAEHELDVDFPTFESLLHPDDLEPTKAAIEAHLKERVPFNVEQRLRTKSGEYRWFNARGQALWDEDGRPIRMIGSTADITERKRAEEALRQRMEQLSALARAGQAVTSSLDLQQVLTQIVALAGQVVGPTQASVVLVDEAGQIRESAEAVPGVPAIEYRVRHAGFTDWIIRSHEPVIVDDIAADGTVSPAAAAGAPQAANPALMQAGIRSFAGLPLIAKGRLLGVLFLHSTQPYAFHGQLDLLTAFASQAAIAIENARLYDAVQKELAARKEAEEAYRVLVEHSLQGLVIIQDGRVVFANPALVELSGYSQEELLALSPEQVKAVVHPEDQERVWGNLMRRLAGEPIPPRREFRFLRKDGQVRWVEILASRIEYRGRPAIQAAYLDITERKQAEEALRVREAELAAIFESTPILLALVDEERRVTKINRAGSEFVGRPASELLGLPQGEVLRCLHALDDPRGCGYGPHCEQCVVRRTVLDTLQTGRSHFQVEADYPVRRDGRIETLRLLVSTAPVATPAGPRVLVCLEDITVRHRTHEALRAVYDLSQKLVLSQRVEEIAQLVTDAAQGVLRFPRCELWLADEQARAVVPISQTPAEPALTIRSLPLDDERGIIPAVVRSGQAIYLPDVDRDPRYIRGTDYPTRSELCVPLRVRERTIGALNAESDQPDAFGLAERELLEALANAAAVAIENARLYQESRRRAGEMAALREVSLATLSTLEREQVFEIMLAQLSRVIDHDTAAIKVITPEGRDRMIAGRGPVVYDQAMWNGFDVKNNKLVQEMRATGQPVVVHDTRSDERYEKAGDWQAFPSWAGAPLFVRGDFVGYLAVEKTSPGFYDEHAAQLLGDFARAAAIALENARLYEDIQRELTERQRAEEALRRRLDELTVLQAIAAAGAESADEDTLIARATQIIGDVFHPDNFGVVLLDEASGLLHPHPSHRLREAGVRALSLRLGEGIVGQVALTGRPRRVPDVRLDPDYVEGDPQTRSELCVPIKAGERVIGVINSESTALDAYSEDDERLLSAIAGQLATALEKIRLFEQTERRALEMTSLYTIALRLATAGELNELLQTIVRQAVGLLEAAGGYIYLHDQATDELELTVVHGIVREEDLGTRLQRGEGLSGKVMQERRPLVVDDYRTWEGRSPKYEGRPYTATVGVPLLWQDQLIGVLDVLDDREQRTFDEDDVRLLTLLAQQAAAAIANARSLQAEQKRAAQLAAINELGRSLAATLDLPTICRTAYHHVQQLVDCPYFGISLFDPEQQVIRVAFAMEEGRELDLSQFPPLRHKPQARTGRSKAIASSRPELVPDLPSATRQSKEVYHIGSETEPLSALYVPMIVEGRVIGLLEVQSYRPDAYRQEDVELLGPVANHIGLAIQNARLFGETRQLKEFNESIVQSMAEGIFIEDADGFCTFVNPAAAELLGYAPAELVGQHWTAIIPPDQQPIVQAANERRVRGQADRYEVELVRKDGRRLSVLVSGSPRFENGRFVGTMAVFTDISERKRAEAQLAEQLDELRRWHAVTLGREMRVLELKREVNALLRRLNEPIRYPSAEEESNEA
ncbi:MAG: GAF domain-containing protein [Anaerolineae bacterium]|nr:GAF domain-containing protein [Anaerolineae bacterium]